MPLLVTSIVLGVFAAIEAELGSSDGHGLCYCALFTAAGLLVPVLFVTV